MFELSHLGKNDWLSGIGGDVSNVAIAAARQGASVGMVAQLGNDRFSDAIRDTWDVEGVDHTLVRQVRAPTGIYFIRQEEEGHSFEYRRKGSAASKITPRILDGADLSEVKMLHCSGITLAISDSSAKTAYAAALNVRAEGGRIAFDPNFRSNLTTLAAARAAHRDWFAAGCDIALPGLEDARRLTGRDSLEDIIDWYQELGADIVALTLGADGALIAEGDDRHRIPPRPATQVDASGAGDCFDGCFLARLLAGDSTPEAASYAVTAASLSVEGHGAVTPIPHATRVLEALAQAC